MMTTAAIVNDVSSQLTAQMYSRGKSAAMIRKMLFCSLDLWFTVYLRTC